VQPSRRHPTPPAAPSDDRPAGSEAGGSGNATAVPGDPPLPTAMLSDRILASFTTRPQLLPAFFDMLCNDIGTQLAAMQSAHDAGDPVAVERADEGILVNRMPVRKFYTRTINGLVELAGAGWRRLGGKG